MDKYDFRTEEGLKINLVEHTLEQIQKHSSLKIYIGTDSQDYGSITRYVTAVVYRYGHRGAHCVFFVEEVKRMRDMFTRLYDEGVRTVDACKLITADSPVSIEALEFDYADVKKTESTRVVGALRGWVKGLNQNANFKQSGGQLSTKYADHICRHWEDISKIRNSQIA